MSAEMKDMLFISIHCNSFPQDPSVNGIEIYFGHPSAIRRTEEQWLRDDPRTIVVNPSYDMYDIASRRRLALLMRDNLLDGTDLGVRKNSEDRTGQSDGIFHGDYCVIRENNITGVLFEVGFLTNADDRGFFSEPAGQKRIAHSIAESVYDYFCVPPDGSQS